MHIYVPTDVTMSVSMSLTVSATVVTLTQSLCAQELDAALTGQSGLSSLIEDDTLTKIVNMDDDDYPWTDLQWRDMRELNGRSLIDSHLKYHMLCAILIMKHITAEY